MYFFGICTIYFRFIFLWFDFNIMSTIMDHNLLIFMNFRFLIYWKILNNNFFLIFYILSALIFDYFKMVM